MTSPVLFQALPPLSPEEYKALEDSILAHGIQVPIILDENGVVIDGHHRQKIAQSHDLPLPSETRTGFTDTEKRTLSLSLNLDRRHLSREQKRALIAESIKADPQLSDREHGRRTGADNKTAAVIRQELEANEEIPHYKDRVTASGKSAPGVKPRPTIDPADPQIDADVDVDVDVDVKHLSGATPPAGGTPIPIKRKRKPITQMAVDAGWELRKAVDGIDALRRDDRYKKTENEVIEALAAHIAYTQELLNEILGEQK